MTITRGKIHKYLGTTIDYSSPGKIILSTVNYIDKRLNEIPEYKKGESATPATHNLFDIAGDATKLSQTDTYLFGHFAAHVLY